jgi:hypothetical protein
MTFTPSQFNNTFKELNFLSSQGPLVQSNIPNAPPVPTTLFSKDSLVVVYNPVEFLLIFQILNTVDFQSIYNREIIPILARLNLVEEAVSMRSIECTTQIRVKKSPIEMINSLIEKKFMSEMSSILGMSPLKATTLRIVTSFPFADEGLQILMEPLATDATGSYYLQIIFRTQETSKFDEFINRFGTPMIQKIAEEAGKYV